MDSNLNKKFTKLYKEYYESIYRFVYYNIQNKSDVEDIVAQTFYKAFINIKQCKGNFRPWLYQIARNNIRDKAKSFESKRMDVVEDQKFESFTSDEDEKNIENTNLHKYVLERVEELKPDLREAFLMRYVDEMEYREIAKIMSKTEGAVRILVSKALKVLKVDLEKERKNIRFIFIPPLMSGDYLNIQDKLGPIMKMNAKFLTSTLAVQIAAVISTISVMVGGYLVINFLNEPKILPKDKQVAVTTTTPFKVLVTATPTASTNIIISPKDPGPYDGWDEYTNTVMGIKYKLPKQLYINGNLVETKVVDGPYIITNSYGLIEGETGINNAPFIMPFVRGICGEGLSEEGNKYLKNSTTDVNILGTLTKVTYYSAEYTGYYCRSFDYLPFESADGTKTFSVNLAYIDDGPTKINQLSNTAKKILESMEYVR